MSSERSKVRLGPEIRARLERMAADFGLRDPNALVLYLLTAHEQGLLMVLNKAAKEVLIGAAEERVLKIAQREARRVTLFTLWEEGYRSDPYEH